MYSMNRAIKSVPKSMFTETRFLKSTDENYIAFKLEVMGNHIFINTTKNIEGVLVGSVLYYGAEI